MTVNCPLDCEYLQESRERERRPDVDPSTFPNQDIRVSESFLRDHEPLLLFLASMTMRHSLDTAGAVDSDVREALDSLVKTYRTLQSGLVYESMPQNPIAAAIHERLQGAVAEFRQQMAQTGQGTTARDFEILGVLVFLQRLALQHDNGRLKGRGFVDFLSRYFVPPQMQAALGAGAAEAPHSGLIIP